MKRIALLIDTMTAEQLDSLSEMLAKNPDNQYVGSHSSAYSSLPGLAMAADADGFLEFCCNAHDLIIVADDDFAIEEKMLNSFFSNKVGGVWHIVSSGKLKRYKLNNPRKSSVLVVFPGSILPLTLGSHQRVFNLLFNLAKNGIAVDVLVTTPKNTNPDIYKHALRTVCSNVYVYKNNKSMLSRTVRTKRFLELKARIAMGKSHELPELFSERLSTRPTESCKRWVNSLYLANKYKTVIVSYAWMMGAVDYINHDSENFKLICDTHDVQFTRNLEILNRKERVFYNKVAEKRCELRQLKKCDSVLAISVSDENLLKKALKKTNVIRASSGFDYALSNVRYRPGGRPLQFGFIGGQMSANVKSLLYILEVWWPIIQKYSPDSKFLIAGSICKAVEILPKTFLDTSVVPLGFVDSIGEFYNKIDVSLNPVLVQGGLNFKSVEAVFAGRHLLTNRLGQECLGENFPSTIIDDERDIVSFMSAYEFDLKKDYEKRTENQNLAKQMFVSKHTYNELINFLIAQN